MSTPAGLEPVLAALEIVSPTAVRLAGRPHERPTSTPAEAANAANGAVAIPLITELLYGNAYMRPFDPAAPAIAAPPAPVPGDDLTPALSAARGGLDRWEEGWEVRQALTTGRVVAERRGQARFLWPGEFVAADGPGMAPMKGMRLRVWRAREAAALQPGFWYAFGAAGTGDELPLLRFYWNLHPDAAPALTAALTGALDRHGLPFRFKCLSLRSMYPRTDAAVLYVARRWWTLGTEIALTVRRAVGGGVGGAAPLFTRALEPGLAFAEDPGSGESFGMHRCRLVAQGVWEAWRAGRHAPDARMEAVADALRGGGVDPGRPWLSAGSPARYELPDAA